MFRKKVLWLSLFIAVPLYAFEFPALPGWQRASTMERYSPDNLFEYIDGAAEFYLSFGFKTLEVAEYTSGDASVVAEIYRLSSPEEAFGIYAQERPRVGKFRSVGYQAYPSGDMYFMVAAEYYIKLIGNQLGPAGTEQLETFAVAFADIIPGAENSPKLLTVFPPDSLLADSQAFIARNFLGYPFFNRAYTADYPGFRLFVIDALSDSSAEKILKRYAAKLNTALPVDPDTLIVLNDPHHGTILIRHWSDFIWGAFGIRFGPAADYLEKLGSRLQAEN